MGLVWNFFDLFLGFPFFHLSKIGKNIFLYQTEFKTGKENPWTTLVIFLILGLLSSEFSQCALLPLP